MDVFLGGGVVCIRVYLQTSSCTLPTLSELNSVQSFLLFGLCSVREANHLPFVKMLGEVFVVLFFTGERMMGFDGKVLLL